jgi:hypothetical protein
VESTGVSFEISASEDVVQNEPAGRAASDQRLYVDHYRTVCHAGNLSQRIRGGISRPLIIDEERRVEDSGFGTVCAVAGSSDSTIPLRPPAGIFTPPGADDHKDHF